MYRSALAVLTLFVLVGCESNTADVRLRKYLSMDPGTPITEVGVRAAALRLIPPGSNEQQVREIVASAGIGTDGLSRYDAPREGGPAHITISLDPRTFGLVKSEYSLSLQFSREGRLQDIQVRKWLTGL
jgi:hypothetical protein